MSVRSFCTALLLVFCSYTGITYAANNGINGLSDKHKKISYENLSTLGLTLKQYLEKHYARFFAEANMQEQPVKISVNQFDPRLRLHKCDKGLTFSIIDRGIPGGHITVKVMCKGNRPWSFFAPAVIERFVSIVTASHSLAKGTIISENDLAMRQFSTADLTSGFISEPQRLVGKQLKRPVNEGDIFRLPYLVEPAVIRKGDAIRIEAGKGHIQVLTQGTALSDGRIGQQIRVRNARSERVIKVEVIARGRVRAIL